MRYHKVLFILRGKMRKTKGYVPRNTLWHPIELSYVVNGANPQAKIAQIIKAAHEE